MFRAITLPTILTILLVSSRVGFGQIGGGLGGGGLGGGGGGGGNNQNSAGIKIDSDGVLSLVIANDGMGTLDKKRRELFAKKSVHQEMNQRTKLRMVSLVELEKHLEQFVSEQKPIPDELFFLAGLQRIDHVFVSSDDRDLVIAGPAEGFVPDGVGRMIGIESGRPALRLDDLVVALRTIARSKKLGCSIDPDPQRLSELQRFIRQGTPAGINEVEARFNQMDDILGLQNVRIDGVPPDSHFATVLVEADYRMKRIAIGVENPQIKGFKSHLSMLGTGGNSMQRWWFVPFYEFISRSDDRRAFQFVGQRAQLLSEEEIVDVDGNRSSSTTTRKSIQAFAKHFTEKFPQLADKSPIFSELQNLIDWSVFAALLKKEQIAERIGWKQDLLLDESRLVCPTFDVPKKVPSLVSYKNTGSQIVGLVSGGIVLHPQSVVDRIVVPAKDSKALDEIRLTAAAPKKDATQRWWWDVAR